MTASEITYLVRHLNLHSKLISPGKDKTRVLLEASANIDEIESILLQQLVGELGVLDHADHADSQLVANGLLDLDGEGSLVGGTGVWVLGWVVSSGGDIQDIHTLFGQDASELGGVVSGPGFGDVSSFLEPVGGGDAEEEGHVLGDDRAGLFGQLDGETGAVLEATAVVVRALVRNGTEEGVDQVAVSSVDLNGVETGCECTLDGSSKRGLEVLDVLQSHLPRRGVVLVPGDRTRGVDIIWPAVEVLASNGTGGQPRSYGACFPASVGELNHQLLALAVSKFACGAQALDLAVFPESNIFRGDAAICGDGGCFDASKTGTSLHNTSDVRLVLSKMSVTAYNH
jgi:hypothetical protein